MASEIVVSGVSEFDNRLDEMTAKTDIAARNIVTKGALIIGDESKAQFRPRPAGSQRTSKKTGRIYYAGAPKYPAAPPKPTTRSGNLRSSIRTINVTKLGASRWSSDTGPTVKYGIYVDYGTSRARAFPFMELGLLNSETKLKALAETEWATALA
jgi:hypothetical protein